MSNDRNEMSRRRNTTDWRGLFVKRTYTDEAGNPFEGNNARYATFYEGRLLGYSSDLAAAEELYLTHLYERGTI